MAQQYDGSIRINTKIDQAGFKKGISEIQGSVNRLGSSLKSLAKTIGAAFGVAKIVQFGKEAISLASDLNEVQNVVETAFGGMSTQVDAWAKNSIKQFGMSELAAKRMASTYMSMSVGSGLQGQGAADMAMKTAERAADISSFYNKSLEESDTMLKSIWTGETESLKQIGVVMTQTNLDAFALANGFGKTTKEMTQGEQIMLRYQYVMNQTRLAAGDFVKTQDSWANQTKVLSEQWKQFMSVVGDSLIQVLTPALQFLNAFVFQLVQWATTVNQIITSLFGGDAGATGAGQAAMNGAASATEDAAAAQDDLAGSTKDANEQLKEQIKNVSGLDEINTFATAKSSGSAGAGASNGTGDLSKITSVQDQIQQEMSEIQKLIQSQDWAWLGAYIANGINAGMQKVYDVINWNNIQPKVEPFVTGFTQTFNSLVDNINWDLMGRTLGAGINTVVGTLIMLITGIDWVNLGASFANGLNGMFDEVDWYSVGTLIGEKFMIAWDTFYGFVTTLDWAQVGFAVANGINGAVDSVDLGQVAGSVSTFIVGLLDAFIIAVQNTDWTAVGKEIADALRSIDWVGIGTGLFGAGVELISGLFEAFTQLPAPVQIAGGAVGTFYAITKGAEFYKDMKEKLGGLKGNFDKFSKFVSETALPKISGAFSKVSTFITATVIPKITTALSTFFAFLAANPVVLIIAGITAAVVGFVVLIATKGEEIKAGLQQVNDFLQNIFAIDWSKNFGAFGEPLNAFFKNFENIWNAIKRVFDGVIDFVRGVFTGDWQRAWQGVQDIFGGIFDGLIALAKAPINGIIGLLNMGIDGINSLINGFNSIGIDLPDWMGGYSWHPSIPNIPKIPYLAQGAVIPPNQQFLAVLGDQKKGNNLEGPESMFRQIVREESGNGSRNTYTVNAQVGRKTLFQLVIDEAKMTQARTGKNPFVLA